MFPRFSGCIQREYIDLSYTLFGASKYINGSSTGVGSRIVVKDTAVVVHLENALVTHPTMVSTRWLGSHTQLADDVYLSDVLQTHQK